MDGIGTGVDGDIYGELQSEGVGCLMESLRFWPVVFCDVFLGFCYSMES